MMNGLMSLRFVILLLLCACDGSRLHFVSDSQPGGPSLFVEADVDEANATLTIRAAELGAAFGLSYHVVVDDDVLQVGAVEQSALLGEDAWLVAHATRGDIVLGGTRSSPALGEIDIEDGVIATIALEGRADGKTRVDIAHAVLRRADGSFEAPAVAGGSFTFGAEP